MRLRKLVPAALVAPVVALVMVAAPASPAYAQVATGQICGNGGTGYCINAWGGGPSIKMYYGGNTNETFNINALTLCDPAGTVTETCPFNNTEAPGLNNSLLGDPVVDFEDASSNNQCIAAGTLGHAAMGSCPTSSGSGGAAGTIDVLYLAGQNGNHYQFEAVNRAGSNGAGYMVGLASSGSLEGPLDYAASNLTLWGLSQT
jgi:hypothetical protein